MAATLEDFSFGSIRDALRDEFGGSTALNTELGRKINDAMALIWQECKWRWSLKYLTLISYQQATSTLFATANIGNGVGTPVATNAFSPSGTPVAARWTMRITGDANEYMIATVGLGPPNTIYTQGLGIIKTAASGVAVTFNESWSVLPADFAYMHTLRTESGTTQGKEPTFIEPWVLEKVRKGQLAPGPEYLGGGFYAITPDPFPYTDSAWQPNRQYIGFWPYPTALTKWDGYYYAVAKGMTADADIFELPRGYRRRLFFKAAELMAAKLRDFEAVQYYATQAAIGAQLMADANSFADDTDQPLRSQPFSYSQLIQGGVVVVP